MTGVTDSQELRGLLHAFVQAYVVQQPSIVSARITSDDAGPLITVRVEPDAQVEVPAEFRGLRVACGERQPGLVAAGPVMSR